MRPLSHLRQVRHHAYSDLRFRMFIDRHFREALVGMIAERSVTKQAVSTKRVLAVSGDDRLIFPAGDSNQTA